MTLKKGTFYLSVNLLIQREQNLDLFLSWFERQVSAKESKSLPWNGKCGPLSSEFLYFLKLRGSQAKRIGITVLY